MTGLVVVGGGPAGLSAAAGYRSAGGQGDVTVLSADSFAPYARPPLTKGYLRGEAGADELPLVPDEWYDSHQVSLHLSTGVLGIDTAMHAVQLTDGTECHYDRLCLCTGSSPIPMPVPGGDLPEVLMIRTRDSGDALRGVAGPGHRVMVLGSGFIGCEAAASLAKTGAEVVLATDEQVPHLQRLGQSAGDRIARWLTDAGVRLVLGAAVTQVAPADNHMVVTLAGGRVEVVDHVVSGGGIKPATQLAEAAGLRMAQGGVSVGSDMQTSDADIWAAGDVAFAHNEAAGRALRVEHWGEAEIMGDIAGRNAAGQERHWDNVPGFWSTIGDHTIKYAAWGDGFDAAQLFEGPDGWAVWYARDGVCVGVLTSDWDAAYDYGSTVVARHGRVSFE